MVLFFSYLQESFARAKNWVKELQRQASPNIVIALSGNKADLANKRAVDFQVRANKQAVSWLSVLFCAFLGSTHLLLLMEISVVLFCMIISRTYIVSDSFISLYCQDLQSQYPSDRLFLSLNACMYENVLKTHGVYVVLTGRSVLRRWQQLTFHGDVGQDIYECEWDIYGYWWVILDTLFIDFASAFVEW